MHLAYGRTCSQRQRSEADALRYALDLGIQLIDTAEMYGEGGAGVIGEAIQGRRADAVIVSKVYPLCFPRGSRCLRRHSLRRPGTDVIDLYHCCTGAAFAGRNVQNARLRDAGKIRDFGVSGFDYDDLQEVAELGIGTFGCQRCSTLV
ncbi:MAG: aldo/keto reductase [Gammaproteobacteria bacterium]